MVIDTSLIVAVLGLGSTVGVAAIALRSKKIEVGSTDISKFRTDLVSMNKSLSEQNDQLSSQNVGLRGEISQLNNEVAGLRVDIREFQLDLDQTRSELAAEKRARRAGDAGMSAEHKSQNDGGSRTQARQAGRKARTESKKKTDDEQPGDEDGDSS